MEKEIYIGRQPILTRDNQIFAYALLYRDIETDNYIASDRSATASLLVGILNQFGMQKIIGEHPAFIIVDSSFLLQDMVLSIPKDHFVLCLREEMVLGTAVTERIQQLHKEGYRFAINDATFDANLLSNFQPVLRQLSFLKINTTTSDPETVTPLIEASDLGHIELIATKVETHQTYDLWAQQPVKYFQGYYFSRPKVISEKVFAPEQMAVMQIWRLVMDDVPVKEISDAFEQYPALSLQLLRYMNSAMFHFKDPIKSIAQVITLLGRLPLLQWLLLLINAKNLSPSDQPSAMQSLLINRMQIMIGLHKLINHKSGVEQTEVYFVGLLSLIDILMGASIRSVAEELNVDQAVTDAIFHQKGELGDILTAARAIEHFDTAGIEAFLQKYGVEMDDIVTLTLQTIEKVNNFEANI